MQGGRRASVSGQTLWRATFATDFHPSTAVTAVQQQCDTPFSLFFCSFLCLCLSVSPFLCLSVSQSLYSVCTSRVSLFSSSLLSRLLRNPCCVPFSPLFLKWSVSFFVLVFSSQHFRFSGFFFCIFVFLFPVFLVFILATTKNTPTWAVLLCVFVLLFYSGTVFYEVRGTFFFFSFHI